MSNEIETKKKIKDLKVSLTIKEIVGVGSFLIYLGIAIAGYYALKDQVARTAEDFEQLSKDVNGIMRNLDVIQVKQADAIEKLKEVSNKITDVDRKIDQIGYDIGSIAGKKK